MNKIKSKYKLQKGLTNTILKEYGFRNGKYRVNLYKNLIYLIVCIDLTDNWWTYQVCNEDCNTLYIPYYNRLYGNNELVKKLDKKIAKAFNEMTIIFQRTKNVGSIRKRTNNTNIKTKGDKK